VVEPLVSWLIRELEDRAWSHRELARRAGLSQTTVSQVIAGQRSPTWDFCAVIAGPLGVPVDEVFVRAGLKPPLPPAVEEEREAVAILRAVPALVRDTVMVQLRALAGEEPVRMLQGTDEGDVSYQADEDLAAELLAEFRKLPRVWKVEAVREVGRLRRYSEMQVRFVGEGEEDDSG